MVVLRGYDINQVDESIRRAHLWRSWLTYGPYDRARFAGLGVAEVSRDTAAFVHADEARL
jgi:hypothetical protein